MGENAGRYRRPKKFAKQIKSKSSGKPTRQKPVPPLKPGKRGPSDLQNKILIRVKNLSPTRLPSAQWVKKVIFCLLENIRFIRDGICTGHIRREGGYTSVYPEAKKIQTSS